MGEPDRSLLVLHLRRGRAKAGALAVAEAAAVLDGLGAAVESGGPLADKGGVYWLSLPAGSLDQAERRLPLLGYTVAADVVEPARDGSGRRPVKWRGAPCRLVRLYEEVPEEARGQAVDRRVFTIATASGWKEVRGYRGDGGALSRRGLAVADSRLLVNLAVPGGNGRLLDPFAGTGGLILHGLAAGNRAMSLDRDPVVAPGLHLLTGGRHTVGSAGHLPFRSATFDGVAGEPPFDPIADQSVLGALPELAGLTRAGGRIVLMGPERQVEKLRSEARRLSLDCFIDAPLDRKGLRVTVIGWTRPTR